MPRVGRVVLPHYPHHIVQRGHNRQVVLQWTRILNIIWKPCHNGVRYMAFACTLGVL